MDTSSNIVIADEVASPAQSPLTKLKSLPMMTKIIIAAVVIVVIMIIMFLLKGKMGKTTAPEGFNTYLTSSFQQPRFGFASLMKN